MTDFSNLQNLKVEDNATTEFVFYGIAGEPTLTVRPAGNTNKPFFNAVLAKNKQLSRKMKGRKGQVITAEALEEARQEDILMFVKYIITGWKNVVDAKGKAVKFNEDVCRQFLEAIPEDMFDDLRVFCLEISNFREVMDDEELEELSGN